MLNTRKIIAITKAKLINSISINKINGIACDSKKVKKGFLFVAIKGTNFDGHNFIKEAIRNGAVAVVVQNQEAIIKHAEKVSFILAKDTRQALAKISAEFYGNPSSRIKVIAVTGTNGKTTVTYLIEKILKEAKFNPGVVGTVNYRFKEKIFNSTNTTPGPLEIQSLLARMLKHGIDYCIMEVSSHALDQERVEGISFKEAIFTNLTQDHLDYHKTLENYFSAKAKLFVNLKKSSTAIINLDDKVGKKIRDLTKARTITYAIDSHADIKAKEIKLTRAGSSFFVSGKNADFAVKTSLIGRHNIYNLLAAIASCLREGIDVGVIQKAIAEFSFVPGRLELIESRLPFQVFIDYAHTEDALRNVLLALRNLNPNRILLVFGCGGDRDRDKRPKMGDVASRLADFSIVTSDNPRSEEPAKIAEEILSGFKKNNYQIILERKEAIKNALSLAREGDALLIAGKGHESYQIFKDKIIPFSDKETVLEFLK